MNSRKSPRSFFVLASYACMVAFMLFAIPGLAQQSVQVLHKHVRPLVSSGRAALVGPLPLTQQMHVSIILPLRNEANLNSLLSQLHDQSSPNYRKFLSVAQFTDQFGPTAQDYQAVVNFAQANGFTVTDSPANRLIVPISGTVAQIERAFNVKMNLYQHPTENRTFFSTDREPTLNLKVPVRHIAGLDNYSIPHSGLVRSPDGKPSGHIVNGRLSGTIGSGPYGSFLASDMRAAYYGGTTLTGSGQSVGIVAFDGYDLSDVNNTFSYVGQSYSVPINNVLLGGASAGSDGDDAEQVLDIVQAIGMAPGLSQVRVYIAPLSTEPAYGGDGDVLIFNQMALDSAIVKQLSSSWFWEPADPTTDDPFFQEFAAQGQSFFECSGDYGAWPGGTYIYPQEDAYVTAVGGTDLTTSGPGGSWVSEAVWDSSGNYGGGGGVSTDGIPIPSYQAGAINSSNQGSMLLRNGPDVSMEGNTDNFVYVNGAPNYGAGGTSFAAPRWAGFMALVNQQAVASGNPTVGFLNPVIYAIGESASYLTDFRYITPGGNNGCCGQTVYWNEVSGYNLVTGWGSPYGQNFINVLAGTPPAQAWIINTVAGNGISSYSGDGGAATSAELNFVNDVRVDPVGNLYIADMSNNRIRMVSASTGVISTIAGNGTAGYSGDGGAATSAELNTPASVAFDSRGNIYIVDANNNRIRMVNASTGVISTIAGNGTAGYSGDGGPATSAELNVPDSVAVDSSGNIFIADLDNNRIRMVNASTGVISTVAGNGTAGYSGDGGAATSAEINYPQSVAIDNSGNIYIAEYYNNRIRMVNASTGVISTVAGNGTGGYSGDGGAATSAELNGPDGVAVDPAGNIYIADYNNNRVRMVNASTGVISTIAGNGTGGYSGDGGAATSAEIFFPSGIAVNSSCYLFIADQNNNRVRSLGGGNSSCF